MSRVKMLKTEQGTDELRKKSLLEICIFFQKKHRRKGLVSSIYSFPLVDVIIHFIVHIITHYRPFEALDRTLIKLWL